MRCGLSNRYQRVDLCPPMKSVVLVVCTNELGLHRKDDLVEYIFYGNGWSIDDPSYEECREITKTNKNIEVIKRQCMHCRKLMGIKLKRSEKWETTQKH